MLKNRVAGLYIVVYHIFMKKFHKQICIFLSDNGVALLRSVPGLRMATIVRIAIAEKYARVKDQPKQPTIFPASKSAKKRRVFLLSNEHVDMAWYIVRHHSLFSLSEAVRISLKEYFIRLEQNTNGDS